MSFLTPRTLTRTTRHLSRNTSTLTRAYATSTRPYATVQNTQPSQVTQTINQPTLPFRYGSYTPSQNSPQRSPVRHIRIPQFTNLQTERAFRKLHHAAALRWLGYQGYNNEGAGGHVTVRDPIMPDHFWINPHGKSFSWMRPEDLVLVNEEGEVVDGQGGNMHSINPAGYVIHSAIHRARPDVVAAVHCHSVHSKAFSALGCELEPINQDACRFYKDHGIYRGFGGIALEKKVEGEHIAQSLGNTKAVLLQNHGLLTVAKTVDGAAFLFGAFDRCIQAQLLADAAAGGRAARNEKDGAETIKVSEEEAEYTRNIYNDEMTYIMFQSAFEDVVRASGGELSLRVEGEMARSDGREERVGEVLKVV